MQSRIHKSNRAEPLVPAPPRAYPQAGSSGSEETLDDAVLKYRLKRMSELIAERAGKEAGDRFYALGLAHLKGPEEFQAEFNRLFPERQEP